ncbi:MAG: hypothetical protein J6C19_07955 [Lachnospiraceae bacterium]|nr:hypothetical protein [Lachnospiraceae bacterium]MBO5145451.1 hypothetical protein [Lachnospiraceae bacterium]
MVKAETTIIVGKKTYHAGQTVTGLSEIDKKWMKKAGYITETAGRKDDDSTKLQQTEKEKE